MTVDGNGEQVGRKTRLFRATEYSEETPTAFIERVPSTEAARISLLPESETEKRSEEDECMMVVERLVARLHTHNLLPAQSDQLVNPIQVKLQLLGFKKQHPELISEKGDLFNLFSWVRKAPHGMHVNLRTLLSATIGDTFGKRLPDRQQRRVLQQIDVALANHYGEAEDIA